MRLVFLMILYSVLTVPTNIHAEGLPANPWAAKQEVIGDTVLHVTREDINHSTQEPNENPNNNQEIRELQHIAASLKEKWNQKTSEQTQEQNEEKEVDTIDALNALNTLSRYMNKNNNNDGNEVSNQSTDNSPDFSSFKEKISALMNKKKAESYQQNSQTSREFNKAKYEYNRYKSQLSSNYNTLKNKAKPVIDTMKKSVQEAEKASGIKF